jgi:APA family basic amino acid/polyamine antiporter
MRLALAVGLGSIIGAGIFVLSGTAIALAGSGALIAFVFVGILATIVALELGELSSIMPKAKGAAYSYAYNAFGSEVGFITGILLYFSFATSISVVALGFGSYFTGLLGLPAVYSDVSAIGLIFLLSVVNIVGIKKAAKADFGLVLVKLCILSVFIVAAAALALGSGAFSMANFSSSASQSGILPIFAASIAVFFAYSGFQSITTFTSRIRGGSRAAAKAILYSVIISMVLYVLVVLVLLLMVPASHYSVAADPLAFALRYAGAPYWLLLTVSIGALIATASAAIAMILSSSRVMYQISSDRLLPRLMRRYDRRRDVAVNGVIISAVIAVIMLFSGNIYVIAAISNFGLIFSYLMVSFAVIHFRRIGRKAAFRVPLYPYLTAVAIVLLVVFMVAMPQEALTIGVVMVVMLLMAYYFLREFREKKVIRVKLFR